MSNGTTPQAIHFPGTRLSDFMITEVSVVPAAKPVKDGQSESRLTNSPFDETIWLKQVFVRNKKHHKKERS